jgi:hypothetical protein
VKKAKQAVPVEPWAAAKRVLDDAQNIIEAARRYCDVRNNPVPGQHESVEPFYYDNLNRAVEKLFGSKGSAGALSEATAAKSESASDPQIAEGGAA